mmetsp:Transcript_28722/g.45037  ORF Transcript_28722/g.45037 Transcript_28722/m.45037 type:complete len:94 (+) Transcript_28722:724-1005(+)
MEEGKVGQTESVGDAAATQVPAGLSDLLQDKEKAVQAPVLQHQAGTAPAPAPAPSRPVAPQADAELMARKRALEKQLQELEEQMKSTNTHHND